MIKRFLAATFITLALPLSAHAQTLHLSHNRTPPTFLSMFNGDDLHCGNSPWTMPVLIGGSFPSSACIINWPKNNTFGGPFGF